MLPHRSYAHTVWLALWIGLTWLLVTPSGVSAQYVRRAFTNLSAGFGMQQSVGPLSLFQLTPDGGTVVFVVRGTGGMGDELYAAALPQGLPVRLHGPTPTGTSIGSLTLTPDGTRAVYCVGVGSNPSELYSVAIDGGAPVKLSGPVHGFGVSCLSIRLTPDGNQVVYIAPQDRAEQRDLYRVPVVGGAPVRLTTTLTGTASVLWSNMSADGAHIVFHVAPTGIGALDIYSVPLDGGTAVQLNPPNPAGVSVGTFQIAPDGSRVVFPLDSYVGSSIHSVIHSVPISGGAAVTLATGFRMNSEGPFSWTMQITADSAYVVFPLRPAVSEWYRLYSVPIAGGDLVRLDNPDFLGTYLQYQLTADGRVLFLQPQEISLPYGADNLYVAPVTGGTPLRLTQMLQSEQIGVLEFIVAPNVGRVAFVADQEVNQRFELYSVSLSGGATLKLSGPLVPGGDVSSARPRLGTDGVTLTYLADQETDGLRELFQVAITGGPVTKVSGHLGASPSGVQMGGWDVAADNRSVVYVANVTPPRYDLFSSYEELLLLLPFTTR